MTRIELPSGRLVDASAAGRDAEIARIAASFGHGAPWVVTNAVRQCPDLPEEVGPVKLIDLLFAQHGPAGTA